VGRRYIGGGWGIWWGRGGEERAGLRWGGGMIMRGVKRCRDGFGLGVYVRRSTCRFV